MSGPNGDLGTPVEAGAEGEEDGFGEAGRVRSCRRFPEIPGEHLRAGLWKPQPWRTVVSRACFTDEETEAASGSFAFGGGGVD
ncbi:hypothetical protein JEQ12_013516 [Ovis aries]|uniref:Uncharacterized protein n=1 Tax=Ovis aries TaxID=9940 RepID=A0A836D6Z1_SHEEP|nr:hypothetical protein JEQ12_013516 [Ovis aries]